MFGGASPGPRPGAPGATSSAAGSQQEGAAGGPGGGFDTILQS